MITRVGAHVGGFRHYPRPGGRRWGRRPASKAAGAAASGDQRSWVAFELRAKADIAELRTVAGDPCGAGVVGDLRMQSMTYRNG